MLRPTRLVNLAKIENAKEYSRLIFDNAYYFHCPLVTQASIRAGPGRAHDRICIRVACCRQRVEGLQVVLRLVADQPA